ncbi:hypothetical protein EN45_004920 [Penicillium chrysogenum]|uniref:Uncharacterized protein n=1 Tax=Penicillium chrysogenum TaxID=5076 RepID=A0A167VF26_PENCH|nr:hypothetical protein EN45_004920 [Penicillium chrysogenum]
MHIKYLLPGKTGVAQLGESRFHLRCRLQAQPSARPAQVRPGQHSLVIVSRCSMQASWLYKLQDQSGIAMYHSNNEIMDVSLQNEPLPSNVSIKSSRYRVTRNLIYHSQAKSSEGLRQ